MLTERLSSDKLLQQSVSSMSAETVRCVDSVLEVILSRSGLLYLPGYALTRQDYDCMLETLVHMSRFYNFIFYLSLLHCTSCTSLMIK